MARKSLRTELDEIAGLLTAGEAAAAQKRCLQTLKLFPRNLAAYRLLGKAYLLNGQYVEAADIFLRLLSSLPDDFTAHLGLSLIRESEGKLEAAGWHIERAYEVKPASATLKVEVGRLLARRGGEAVKLSRAALARMYLKGRCYPQAIAEVEAAIREEPARADLLVLLAEAYTQAGQSELAAQTSRAALEKLPFSLQANRIAFEVAMRRGEAEAQAALPYRQRLQELDPYWAYVTPGALDPVLVPEHAVMIEQG